MAFFLEIRNEALIRELTRELNSDIVLFGVDGNTYFGNLQAIDDCRIAILSPAIEADTNFVEILTAGGEVQQVDFTRVDLFSIVGKGTGVVSEPFSSTTSSSSSSSSSDDETLTVVTRSDIGDGDERQESHNLIRQLRRMIGDDVAIGTLGGFLFVGTLSEVCDELAFLTVDDVFVPGTSTGISDTRIRSAVVNLEALTSVSGLCCARTTSSTTTTSRTTSRTTSSSSSSSC